MDARIVSGCRNVSRSEDAGRSQQPLAPKRGPVVAKLTPGGTAASPPSRSCPRSRRRCWCQRKPSGLPSFVRRLCEASLFGKMSVNASPHSARLLWAFILSSSNVTVSVRRTPPEWTNHDAERRGLWQSLLRCLHNNGGLLEVFPTIWQFRRRGKNEII